MSWKDKLFDLDSRNIDDIDDLYKQSTEVKNHDIGLVNQKSGAGIIARENGRIEAFSDFGLGFRIDPETQSLSVFAPNIKLFTSKKQEFSYEQGMTFLKNEYKDAMDVYQKGAANGKS